MSAVDFKQVDVFTSVAFKGNPVAVLLEADGLTTEQMQRIANWTNLSETTFVLRPTRPGADYRVRIFTPQSELPFAGHPTLGTAHALLEAGRITPDGGGELVQECGAGLVKLRVSPSSGASPVISFTLPEPSLTALTAEQVDDLESILGASIRREPVPKLVNVGPVWTIVQLAGAKDVLGLTPDFARMAAFDKRNKSIGVVVYGAHVRGGTADIETRAFAPSVGVNEDPVCGSGNGAVAAFIRDAGQVRDFGLAYVSAQGGCVGRDGKLYVAFEGDSAILVGGQSVTCINGTIAV